MHHDQLLEADGLAGEWRRPFSSLLRSIRRRLAGLASDYASASMYEQLSHLSAAELQRRGLSRATLARDVAEAFRRPP
jgi:hypothetical protein